MQRAVRGIHDPTVIFPPAAAQNKPKQNKSSQVLRGKGERRKEVETSKEGCDGGKIRIRACNENKKWKGRENKTTEEEEEAMIHREMDE